MANRSLALFSAASLAALSLVTAAHAKLARSGNAHVSFAASGPAGLSIVGTTSDLLLNDGGQEVVVVVPLKNLDTKIELRNKHLKEKYLEVDKYPNAELKVARAALQMPKGAPTSGKAQGAFTLHGQTKSVEFAYTAKPAGSGVAVTGTLRINFKDYGIAQPGYAGVTVKPEVEVSVAFVAQDS